MYCGLYVVFVAVVVVVVIDIVVVAVAVIEDQQYLVRMG